MALAGQFLNGVPFAVNFEILFVLVSIAGLVAGAMSMAAGEYVSVRSQADSEQAALNLERAELEADDQGERRELTAIYVGRGVDPAATARRPPPRTDRASAPA